MKILFHENQLGYRGTSVAVYDYALYNEELLGNESVIVYKRNSVFNLESAVDHFRKRFKVLSYSTNEELQEIIKEQNPDIFYVIKSGKNDGIISLSCKTCVHVVFKECDPHGNIYTYVSEWLSDTMGGDFGYVPHIIKVSNTEHNLRYKLGIKANDKVYGYYGGSDSFDINFVRKAVIETAKKNSDTYFIFMGIDDFTKKRFWSFSKKIKNIIFLPATPDLLKKTEFINTCDAMLHARMRGETFGMAIGEFALKGKSIITYSDSDEKAHINILGNSGYYYSNKEELLEIFRNADFSKNSLENYQQFSPTLVMKKFRKVFLQSSNNSK